jgi:peptide/nickel transport system permease protein
MQRYVIRRFLATIPVMFVVALFVFSLLHLAPGDPAALLLGPYALQEDVDAMRHKLGLDRPIPVQLGIWIKDLFQGDLGESLTAGVPVTTMISGRLVPSISLAILIEIFAVGVGVPLGVLAAWKAGTIFDRAVMVLASLGFSVPAFFLGFMMIWAFALRLDLFPAAGYVPPQEDFVQFLYRLIMPTVATGMIVMALITRMTRASVLEVLNEDYIRTARAKGLTETSVLLRHALRVAALPIVTIIGWIMASILGGIVVIEQVFAIPGLGRLMVDAIIRRDYPVIQGAIIMVSMFYVYMNLIIDVSYAYLDPRIRY